MARISGVRVVLNRPFLDVVTALSQRPFKGRTWGAWGEKVAVDALARVEAELTQGVLLGEGIPDLMRRLGKVTRLGRTAEERLARTAVNDAGKRA